MSEEIIVADEGTMQHIVINQDRSVAVPSILKKSIVQRDHNIEKLTFDCPRYWYGKDISTLNIYVNYISVIKKAKKEDPGSSLCENVVIDENDQNMLHFDWIITDNVSEDMGGLIFLVCAKSVDSDGNEDVHWNSHLCKELEVQEGLEASSAIVKRYPDVIESILSKLGKQIELRNSGTAIQYRNTGENTWVDLVQLEDIRGEAAVIIESNFQGSDTTANILAKTGETGDKWYSTDDGVYYMFSSKGEWINCGSGENLKKIEDEISELKGDIGDLYAGNPKTRKKVPEKWGNGYIDTSGNLIANNTGYITQELISFDEDGYTYSLKDTFEGFVSQFKLWIFIYDLSGNYVRGRNESYAVSNLGDAPKPDTQHKYRFMLSTVNWETFSDSNINADKANTILQIKKEIQTPYAKKENLNKEDEISELKGDIGDLYAGNPKTRKKVPEKWGNGYIDTSGNLIANNTGYITQELISFDEDGYTYSLKDTFEGFVSQFKLWIFIYDLSGNYVRGRNESYAVSNLGDAPKPDTQHKYRFMLSTVNWETFSDSNINADKANTILQIKKEIQTPYAKKENLNKTDENVSALDGRVTTLESKWATKRTWKKWNAIGDSITFLDGYEPIVKNALGIESYTNNGKSGFSTPMIGADYINNMSDNYDLITFFMGTNNFGRCNSIAETKTSCESIFSAMANKWQTSDIVIILPIQRWGYTGDYSKGSQPTMTNSDGITLREYCLAIKEIAEKYSFRVLDGYYRSGIIGGKNGNTSNYLSDGLHPNESGNTLIANMIVKFLKANF